MDDSSKQTDFRSLRNHIPFVPEGLPYVLTGVFLTLTAALLGWAVPAVVLAAATVLMAISFATPSGGPTPDPVMWCPRPTVGSSGWKRRWNPGSRTSPAGRSAFS